MWLHEQQKGVALVCTSADGPGLLHHGLLHPPSADLADVVAPLVAERLTRGQQVLVVLPPATAAKLHGRLPSLSGLHTADSSTLYRHPRRVLGHYLNWITETSAGRSTTIVAAPDLGGGDSYRTALWLHIDALTTQVLAACNLTLVCAYPYEPSSSTAVRQAHPSLLNGAVTPSPDHLPPEEFLTNHPLPPPSQLGQPDITHLIDHPAQLTELRQAASGHAARAGLAADRGEDFLLAITEVASNALEHGTPPAAVCWWTTPTSVICQITDNGHFAQPLAGLLPPQTNQRRGRGLWMAHQLCDQVYVWPFPTTVRLHMDRTSSTAEGECW
ncbi:MAG TPA: ATP-binding protein [Pseudonocardiaceae bacterium]|nr:ATP-binding protein [Pseudonocardiaceae bacterium]